jgi:hypothetical protein
MNRVGDVEPGLTKVQHLNDTRQIRRCEPLENHWIADRSPVINFKTMRANETDIGTRRGSIHDWSLRRPGIACGEVHGFCKPVFAGLQDDSNRLAIDLAGVAMLTNSIACLSERRKWTFGGSRCSIVSSGINIQRQSLGLHRRSSRHQTAQLEHRDHPNLPAEDRVRLPDLSRLGNIPMIRFVGDLRGWTTLHDPRRGATQRESGRTD